MFEALKIESMPSCGISMAITTGVADSARCRPMCCNSDSHVGSWRGIDSQEGHSSRSGRNA
ncbi:hypothetical protein DY000_02020896 [Brassica cretica]|uniref:Uncharacterized protein n=1 Tax=Brassica cretica TaxID=69181 RepID=A0ABQ7E6Z9_BRACR|nr:hypothetical protein DY000_02020896 [Brassica cretica]